MIARDTPMTPDNIKATAEGLSGHSIKCANCNGHGIVSDMAGEPDECLDCGGSGANWQYPKGAIACYYSGPLIGRAYLQQETQP